MPEYESSHFASYHELAVWGFVNRFMKSKLHVDINEKSFMSKTSNLLHLYVIWEWNIIIKIQLRLHWLKVGRLGLKSWQVGDEKLAGWNWESWQVRGPPLNSKIYRNPEAGTLFFQANRVELQNLNQTAPGWVSGVQLGFRRWLSLNSAYYNL